jgi:hypothetical protein
MIAVFDHLKLVRRESREMARFRRWVLAAQLGELARVSVLHEHNGYCCKKEPWNKTAASIIKALEPSTPQVLVNLNQPGA